MERFKAQKYFMYLRRSQDAEDRQMASLDDQEAEMSKMVENGGYDVVEVFRESQSAKKPGRPVFNEMLARLHAGEADGIICWKINRLARNPVDGGQISWMLQTGVIRHIKTYSGSHYQSDNVIMMAVELGMANQFVNDLSVDVRRGMRNKAERGWYPQRSLPPGYSHYKGYMKGNEEIVSNDDLPLIKMIFKAMLSGEYSVMDLVAYGTRLGLKGKKGKPLCYNTYLNILTSEFYAGYFSWKDAEGNVVRHKGRHEAILSEDDFNRVQLLLGKRGKPTRTNSYDFPYRGPLACGECGCAVTVDYQLQCICTTCKKKFSMKRVKTCPSCQTAVEDMRKPSFVEKKYYRCTKRSSKMKCSQGSIEEADLTEMINKEIDKIVIDEDFYKWAVFALNDIHQGEMLEQKVIATKINKRTQDLRDRLDQLIVMRADGEISHEQLKRMTAETEKNLQDAEVEQRRLNARTIEWAEIAEGYLNFTSQVKDVFKSTDNATKREILQTLGLNLHIADRELRFTAMKPLMGIQNVYQSTYKELGTFEPKKALDKQGLSQKKAKAFSVLCAGLDSN